MSPSNSVSSGNLLVMRNVLLVAITIALQTVPSWSFSMQPKLKFQSRVSRLQDISSFSTIVDASEGAKGAIESYVNLFIPMFKQAQEAGLAPDVAIKWGHGSAMATVLFAMGGIGAFLGWQIRLGGGSNTYAFTLGKTAREQHPLIMGLAFFFFLLGGQGGLVLLAVQGQPIMESPHFQSALIGMGLLATQAALPLLFEKGGATARSAHAVLGTSTMAVLVWHASNGLNLGLSF